MTRRRSIAIGNSLNTVLLVDDDADSVRVTEALLQCLGYRVQSYTSPRQAITGFRAQPSPIVTALLDWHMPEMTGGELAQHLRRERPQLPVVIMTGYRVAQNNEPVVLDKPFTLQELERVLAQAATMRW